MQTVFIVVVVWIALSLTLGPLLAWAFFYSERRAKAIDAAFDRQETERKPLPRKKRLLGGRRAIDPSAPLATDLLKDPSNSFSERRGSFANHQSKSLSSRRNSLNLAPVVNGGPLLLSPHERLSREISHGACKAGVS